MTVESRLILANAVALLKRRYHGRVLWGLVSELCGLGSTSAVSVCKEMGWNPHQAINAKKPLEVIGQVYARSE